MCHTALEDGSLRYCATSRASAVPLSPRSRRASSRRTALFLFNYKRRTLHGVFEAIAPGALNIDPEAWTGFESLAGFTRNKSTRAGGGSPFPAQVRFQVVHEFAPLPEAKFRHIVTYKASTNQFDFMLTAEQVSQIMTAFIEQQKHEQKSTHKTRR